MAPKKVFIVLEIRGAFVAEAGEELVEEGCGSVED
jgi:hypothetical protein